jgi:hypothetical protein
MAYCRFIDSDAYIYDDFETGLTCCVCSLMPLRMTQPFPLFPDAFEINDNFIAGYDYDKMIAHVAEHRAAGDYIPEYVDEELIEDRDGLHS